MDDPHADRVEPGGRDVEAAAVALTRQFLAELQTGSARARPVTPASALERDLGLDSLCRVELAVRLERAFGVSLSERALAGAVTLGDLVVALRESNAAAVPPEPGAVLPALAEPAATRLVDATTLLEALDWHAAAHPDRVQIVHLGEDGEQRISYRELKQRADEVAAGLQRFGLEPRQSVAIMLPTCPEYFHTFFGVLRAGGVPVPIYPPARLSQIEDHVRRHAGILSNAEVAMLVTVPEARGVARLLEARVTGLRRVVTVAELVAGAGSPAPVPVRRDDIAFIQYTSGSTGNPKGVVLTHGNLLASIAAIGQAIEIRDDDVFVSWLPLYHDMGLICAWLSSLYFAIPLVVMSPLAFLARPERWLQAIQRYRGTISVAPNFAYELCVKRIDDAQLAGLDLAHWRVAANGAEPVVPDTMRRFTERFARCGFRAESMMPVYGLAECTVGLLSPPLGRGPRIDRVRREPLSESGRAEPATADDPAALRFPSCGRPIPGHEVRIVDTLGREVAERTEGRLEFRGPSATSGYFRNPEATRQLFDGDWLDSGDRAYAADGEIYLTGRVKDIVIRGGRNIYPHEVEDAVGVVEGVRRGCVAAFGSTDARSGTERLVVLAETREQGAAAREAIRERIVAATLAVLGEPPDEVVLAPPHTVLKTSSGKVRRAACRELYEAGQVGARAHAGWWQVLRLIAGSLLPQVRRAVLAGVDLASGVYGLLLFALFAPLVWVLTAVTPRPAAAWKLNGLAARALLRLTGMSVRVEGLEHLPRTPCVLVANHASYLDGIVLMAALPQPFGFVAKREFLAQPVTRIYLRRLGVLFVERFEHSQAVDAAGQIADAVKSGQSVAIFPEGTFRHMAGLRPFRLGAFAAAVAGGAVVLPVAIRGTRGVLRDGQWLPRRGPVTITIGAPQSAPASARDAFAASVALRDAARAHILAHCGEPDAGPD